LSPIWKRATFQTRNNTAISAVLFLFANQHMVNTVLLDRGRKRKDMVGTSKILTVSYGTFSCTLEGFDEPFSTMKSISEYFRDLAAEDRYFGAEPPTPDADMLHRIAEHEIKRRVEARVNENSVTLRQVEDEEGTTGNASSSPRKVTLGVADTTATASLDDEAQSIEKKAEKADEIAQDAAVMPAADPIEEPAPILRAVEEAPFEAAEVSARIEEEVAQEAQTEAPAAPVKNEAEILSGDSIAAKLSRIRAVVSGDAPEGAYSEDQHADESFAPAALNAMFDDEDEADALETAPVAEAEFEDEAESIEAEVAEVAEVEADVEAVAEVEAEVEAEIEATDVEAIQEEAAEAEVTAIEEVEADAEIDTEAEDTIALSAITSQLAADISERQSDADSLAYEDEDTSDDISISALIGSMSEPEAIEEAAEEDAAPEAQAEAEQEEEAPRLDASRRARARVIKMRKADFEAEFNAEAAAKEAQEDEAIEAAAPEMIADEEDADNEAETADIDLGDTSLSQDDEAALLAELAAVSGEEGEVSSDLAENAQTDDDALAAITSAMAPASEDEATDEAEAEADAEVDAEALAKELRRARLEAAPVEDDAAVSRLMAETDREFSNSEGSRRRNAIQHLKAAVLANRSDDDQEQDEEEVVRSRFRDDLNRVVKPSRPSASGEGRGAARRLAPLMLVSEQRIDVPTETAPIAAEATPVRPRRISTSNLALRADAEDESFDLTAENDDAQTSGNIFEESTSFADYAETVGASELTDLLEAAAAYTAFVEGRPHFSRPQIMRAVAEVEADNGFSREDGLRSFGQLLRQGKIQKLKRGQFTISQDTRFKPEAKRA
jgi:hypothetical protein